MSLRRAKLSAEHLASLSSLTGDADDLVEAFVVWRLSTDEEGLRQRQHHLRHATRRFETIAKVLEAGIEIEASQAKQYAALLRESCDLVEDELRWLRVL